jgi:hypothetical protein
MQAGSQGAVATRNLQNTEDKRAAQPAKECVTPCCIRTLSLLNCHGWKQLKQHNFILTLLAKQVGHRYKQQRNLAAEQSVGADIQMGLGIYGPALTHLTIEIRVNY